MEEGDYEFQMLLWWGIYVASLPVLKGAEYLVIVGPIFLTLLLFFVSGIPLLEVSSLSLLPPLSFQFLNHAEEVNILILYECRNRQTKSTVTWELIDTIRRQPGIIRALLTPLMALDMCSIRIKSQVFALSVFESLDIVGFTVP